MTAPLVSELGKTHLALLEVDALYDADLWGAKHSASRGTLWSRVAEGRKQVWS